ncbi:MAG: LptF/LptG family permease [Bacteroidota bacterium]
MKKIDKLVIQNYLGPFIMSFGIIMFILVLMAVYPYLQDILGKGIGPGLLGKLVFYATGKVILMALPVAILAAALMTFGGLGENNELASIKSSGISLTKLMRAAVIFSFILAGVSMWFSFEVVPRANLKFYSLYYDLQRKKADVAITPGYFYSDIDNYIIRVTDKHPVNGTMYEVMIYNHSEGRGNNDIILADSARMALVGQSMRMTLYSGARYEEIKPSPDDPQNHPHGRTYFDSLIYRFELKGFELDRTDESQFRHQVVMPQGQLVAAIDSLVRNRDKIRTKNFNQLGRYNKVDTMFLSYGRDTIERKINLVLESVELDSIQDIVPCFPDIPAKDIYQRALVNIRAAKSYAEFMIKKTADQQEFRNNYNFEYYQRLALPFNCIVFMLIGISLGAIIRKGGLGIPALISVLFFLVFYLTLTYGKKFSKEAVLDPWLGAWLSVVLFSPIAIYFTVQASLETSLFNESFYQMVVDNIQTWFRKAFRRITGQNNRL